MKEAIWSQPYNEHKRVLALTTSSNVWLRSYKAEFRMGA